MDAWKELARIYTGCTRLDDPLSKASLYRDDLILFIEDCSKMTDRQNNNNRIKLKLNIVLI